MVTHSEPDILECEVKWALGSITTDKANEGDEIPFELFHILKAMLLKCCTQCARKFGKVSSGHRTENPKGAVPKNVQTTAQLHSFHMLARSCSKSSKHSRRKWQPTPVFLPGESQGRGSLVGCHLWGHTESVITEAT